MYSDLYNELFTTLHDHPQRLRTPTARTEITKARISAIQPYIPPQSSVLEIGCGDAQFSFHLAPHVLAIYGLDVTELLIDASRAPANFSFLRSDGVSIPLDDQIIDFAYSDQLMEHLHPEDAEAQLSEIFRVMKRGASYLLVTPSKTTGPHDISVYFSYTSEGFHLKEYDYRSIRALLLAAGFRRVRFYLIRATRLIPIPARALSLFEVALSVLPGRVRTALTENKIAEGLFGICAIARK